MTSLYPQPLTRRSTRTDDYSPVHTPQHDMPLRHHPKSRRSRITTAQDGVRVYSPSSATSSRSGIHQYEQATPIEDSNPYFPEPSHHRELGRRGTTKELIGRFEAIGGSPGESAARGPRGTPARRGGGDDEAAVAHKKDKGRSPIRQSIRNLLSVFKKNKSPGAPAKEGSPQPPDRSPRRSSPLAARVRGGDASPELQYRPAPPSLTLQIPQDTDAPPRVRQEQIVCVSPVSAHTGKQGPLLYLSRVPLSNIPPVWMECTAQLHSTHILVMWETSQGNPAPKLVPFAACSDVRSLAPGDVNDTERAMLPSETEWKVFELQFEGRARERFAARSLTDRATWVSEIWDAILLAQERKPGRSPVSEVSESAYSSVPSPIEASTRPSPPTSSQTPATLFLNTAHSTESGGSSAYGSQMSRFTTGTQDRDLPPVSTAAEARATQTPKLAKMGSRALSLSEVALSTLPAPPVTPTSTSARSSYLSRLDSPTRTPSPSIRNLDQRSVVKQRLAQIEHGSPRAHSPVSPLARRLGSDSPLAMRRQGTAGSSRMASTVDTLSSPTWSPRSDGLTNFASRVGSPPVRPSRFAQMERDSKLLCPPQEDAIPISPASDYSADHRQETEIAPPTRKRFSTLQSLALSMPASSSPTAVQPAVLPTVAPDTTVKPMLNDIQAGVDDLRARSATTGTNIVNIRTKVDEVLEELRRIPQPKEGDSAADAVVLGKIEGLRTDVKDQFLGLRELVVRMLESEGGKATTTTAADMPDLTDLRQKLDKLVQLSQLRDTKETREDEDSQGSNVNYEKFGDMLALLKDAEDQRAAQLEQQTDSIRYLNELNTWLEAFVKHGTSQIEGVAAGVQQLCRELGTATEQQDDHEGPQFEGAGPSQSNLLSDLRKLLSEHSQREQNTADLHATLNGVAAAIHQNLQQNAEARNSLTTHSLAGMLEKQRRDQENMLKALASELSNDIRGERLRFVEAMKEATAINVQVHVEEFKKELTREVRHMTKEVTRLERERQGLEGHIADLFAFYSKQKQGTKMKPDRGQVPGMQIGQIVPPGHPVYPGAMQAPQPLYRRPLPSPEAAPSQIPRLP